MLSFAEKIRVMLRRREMTVADLAAKTGQSSQNLSNKLARGNFSENEMARLADSLGCDCEHILKARDNGETL